MSFESMAWAINQDLPCTDKMVLLMLANRTNKDNGQCTPSMARLAKDCGLSERTARDAIRRLEIAGYLQTIHRKIDQTTNLSNSYKLLQNVPLGRELPEGGAVAAVGGGAVAAEEPVILEPVIEPVIVQPAAERNQHLTNIPVGINAVAWNEWVDYRKAKKKAISQAAATKQFKLLSDYALDVQQQIINQSIQNDYQGLFAPRATHETNQRTVKKSSADRAADDYSRAMLHIEAQENNERNVAANEQTVSSHLAEPRGDDLQGQFKRVY